jgi:hypothetical protein
MKIKFIVKTKWVFLTLFVLLHGCQDFDKVEKKNKQSSLNNFLDYSLERDYNSYDIEIIEEFMEDIAYNEGETYSNRNAYNEIKEVNETACLAKEGVQKIQCEAWGELPRFLK